jgi:hypothetical protein
MSEPTGLLFAALALFAISTLFRRVFLTSSGTKPSSETISDADPLVELVPLNVLYSESQPVKKTASNQTSSVMLNLAPWQVEVAVEVDRPTQNRGEERKTDRAIDRTGPDASMWNGALKYSNERTNLHLPPTRSPMGFLGGS